jgi:prepilin-type N-terminal cleavage/methylation domain-containing protein
MNDPVTSSVGLDRPRWTGSRRPRASKRPCDHSENGFTLVEMMVVLTLTSVILLITGPVVAMFFNLNNNISETYAATNQLVLSSEVLSQYLHEAVAPCPPTSTASGCSTTPYSSPGPSSLTFYADTNNANGPAKIVITTTGTTITAMLYQATSGCPFYGSLTTACTFPTAGARLLMSVSDLENTTPLSYVLSTGSTCTGSSSSPCGLSSTVYIVAVDVNLVAEVPSKGEPTGFQATAYALAPSYNGTVG